MAAGVGLLSADCAAGGPAFFPLGLGDATGAAGGAVLDRLLVLVLVLESRSSRGPPPPPPPPPP